MQVRLLTTVLDEAANAYAAGEVLEAEWRDGRMWATHVAYLTLGWSEWEAVVPDTVPEDMITEGG
jgi:hypothetical protein